MLAGTQQGVEIMDRSDASKAVGNLGPGCGH